MPIAIQVILVITFLVVVYLYGQWRYYDGKVAAFKELEDAED